MFIDLVNTFRYKQVLPFEVLNALGINDDYIHFTKTVFERGAYIGNGGSEKYIRVGIVYLRGIIITGVKSQNMPTDRINGVCGFAMKRVESESINYKDWVSVGFSGEEGMDSYILRWPIEITGNNLVGIKNGHFLKLNWEYNWIGFGREGRIYNGQWGR